MLSQLLKCLPRHEFEKLANRIDGKVWSTALSRWCQFVALTVGQLNGRQSLRDIEVCLQSQRHLHYHLGNQLVSKSSLARANEQRDYSFYAQLFETLYQCCAKRATKHGFRFNNKLFSLDGSLLDASMKVFPWADDNRKKAAVKLYLGLYRDGLIRCFARITEGRVSGSQMAREWNVPAGSMLIFDKGYNSYRWHNSLTEQRIYWVTRIGGNAQYSVLEQKTASENAYVLKDQRIQYSAKSNQEAGIKPIRLIRYRDAETNKEYGFITNHF